MQLEKIIGLIAGAILIFYLALQVGSGDFFIPIIVALLVLGGIAFFWLKHNIWLMIPVAIINPIPLGFLPIPFKMSELALIFLFAYLFFVHAAMRHYSFDLGPANMWVPLAIVCLIIAFHQFQGGLGLRTFGSEASGARRHLSFLIAAVFLVTMISVRPKNWSLFRRLPGIYLIIVLAGAIPVLFCIYFPSVAMAMGIFGIFASVGELMNFYGEDIQRVGLWGAIGLALQFWLVSRFPMNTWFNVRKVWLPGLSLVALVLCVFSGFRNQIFHYVIITMVAAMLSLRWRALLILIPVVATLAFLVVGNGHWFDLPDSMQRSMSFLPGNWDARAKMSAESSSTFRDDIRDIYMEKYARNSPWFGNGYKFATKESGTDLDPAFGVMGSVVIEMFIRNKDFHIGWISLYDSVGAVGFVAFLWLWYYILLYLRRHAARIGWDHLEPVQVWAICFLLDGIIGYFSVFGGLDAFMVQMMFGAGLAVVVFEQMPPLRASEKVPVSSPAVAALPRGLEAGYSGPFSGQRFPGRSSL